MSWGLVSGISLLLLLSANADIMMVCKICSIKNMLIIFASFPFFIFFLFNPPTPLVKLQKLTRTETEGCVTVMECTGDFGKHITGTM